MTRNFGNISLKISEIVKEEKSIKDVFLMMKLGFTPDNWRRWRSSFIELFEFTTYQKENSEDENVRVKIVYIKKQKLWIIKDA